MGLSDKRSENGSDLDMVVVQPLLLAAPIVLRSA